MTMTKVKVKCGVSWKPEVVEDGNRIIETLNGMYRVRESAYYQGIKLPRRWQAWEFVQGHWSKFFERRSRNEAFAAVARRVNRESDEESEE